MSPAAVSTLPQSAHSAAQNALNAAINDPASRPPPPATDAKGSNADGEAGNEEVEEGQILEAPGTPKATDGDNDAEGLSGALGGLSMHEMPRTVFEDPMTFNVKHPLYTSWTLWFDSPQTKGKSTPVAGSAANMTPSTPMTAQAQNWMEDIKKVINFDSVEEFWGLYNNIVPPSQLPQKANYYLFKDNIIPAWEDEANKYGGKWSLQLPKDKNRQGIDKMWLYTMLAAIGETFDPIFSKEAAEDNTKRNDPNNTELPTTAPPQSLITGVIVSTRPSFYRLSIWTRLAPQINGSPNPSTPVQSNGHGKALSAFGFSPALPPHPSEEGDLLMKRIEAIGKHFKMNVLGFAENAKLGGPLATEVEYMSHKDSEKKKAGKKLVI